MGWENPGPFQSVIIDDESQSILIYDGPPAVNNLITAIVGKQTGLGGIGHDQFNNVFMQGINLYGINEAIRFWNQSHQGNEVERISHTGNGLNLLADARVIIDTNSGNPIDLNIFQANFGGNLSVGTHAGPARIKINSGQRGEYYFERFLLPTQLVATSVTTIIANYPSVTTSWNDYGTQMNLTTGTWTCPETSSYRFSLSLAFSSWVAGSRLALLARDQVSGDTLMQWDVNNLSGFGLMCAELDCVQGDKIFFAVRQETGASRTINATVVPRSNWLSIGRTL
jgi:hypothetical protein